MTQPNGAPLSNRCIALIVSGLALLLTAVGCQSGGGDKPAASVKPPPVQISGSRWALVSLGGKSPEGDKAITLELSAGQRASGFAGVNHYTTSYELNSAGPGRGTLRFGDIGSTRMAGPEPLMKQETAFLDLLRKTDGYSAEGGLLELTAGGAPTLRFRQLGAGE